MFFRIFVTLSVVVSAIPALAETNWSQFRGPNGLGHSEASGLPQKWDASNVLWKTHLKGSGQSSAVNWGDRIFITSASDDGSERYVMGISATDGSIVWEKTIKSGNPEDAHAMNSRATPSCATDGEHVVAFFGPAGIHCFDLDGEKQWSVDLGIFAGSWGIAASPVIYKDTVIQNCDSMGVSRLVALSLKDGSVVWDTPREEKPRGGWSTPILIDLDGRKEMVLNGEFGVRGYDPDSGKELWFCKGFNGRGAPVPDYADGKLYVVNGKPGDTYCVKPGGEGDVTATHMLWHASRKGGRDLPSPAVVDGHLFITSMSAIASCYDAATGEVHYVERLADKIGGAKGLEIAAAPLVVDGLIYLQTVNGGDVIVVRPGRELEVVSVNSLGESAKGETFRATVAPIGGKLFLRSGGTLYCVGG
ncbi:MAG: PQQ-binding-like beta-propeller repeat protein [Verrucomicrobiales bacterium]|nr:PQQ-binding-like beta-propeller repeat protein [Verrucomicrobiales bacterium]